MFQFMESKRQLDKIFNLSIFFSENAFLSNALMENIFKASKETVG